MRDYNINPMTETEVRELLASGSSGYILLNDINRPAVERMVANGELVLNVKHKIFGRVRGGSEFSKDATEVRFAKSKA